jgi:hypothetical protein
LIVFQLCHIIGADTRGILKSFYDVIYEQAHSKFKEYQWHGMTRVLLCIKICLDGSP